MGVSDLFIKAEHAFPFLFGGTFIEGAQMRANVLVGAEFPFLFGGTFIEGQVDMPSQD